MLLARLVSFLSCHSSLDVLRCSGGGELIGMNSSGPGVSGGVGCASLARFPSSIAGVLRQY